MGFSVMAIDTAISLALWMALAGSLFELIYSEKKARDLIALAAAGRSQPDELRSYCGGLSQDRDGQREQKTYPAFLRCRTTLLWIDGGRWTPVCAGYRSVYQTYPARWFMVRTWCAYFAGAVSDEGFSIVHWMEKS